MSDVDGTWKFGSNGLAKADNFEHIEESKVLVTIMCAGIDFPS